MKVLIAHPNEISRQVFSLYCKKLKFSTSDEIIDSNDVYVQKKSYDVVIIDFQWIINSPEMLAWLRNNRVLNNTTTIAVTTDYILTQKKWCDTEGIIYAAIPVTLHIFKKLLL